MILEEPRLAAPLTDDKIWEADGIPVLCTHTLLPQLEGQRAGAQRFNRCAAQLGQAFYAYCRQVLLPEAAASCRAAMETSAPWSAARAELSFRVSLLSGFLLSIVYDERETVHGRAGFQMRSGEVWDLSAGLPVPLSECFPPCAPCRSILLRFAREEILRRPEYNAAARDNWRFRLRRTLCTHKYYLSSEGLCFFCPPGSVAAREAGFLTFTMPYDAEKGPFLPAWSERKEAVATPLAQLRRALSEAGAQLD